MSRLCLDCTTTLNGEHGNKMRCEPCGKERRRAKNRERYWANPEKVAQYMRKYNQRPEVKKRRNAQLRKRYQEEPEYREQQLKDYRDYYHNNVEFRMRRKRTATTS